MRRSKQIPNQKKFIWLKNFSIRHIFFVVLLILAFGQTSVIAKDNEEEFVGKVIARYNFSYISCSRDYTCNDLLLIRLANPKQNQPSFIVVRISFLLDDFPIKLIDKSNTWGFKASRSLTQSGSNKQIIKRYLEFYSETGEDITEKAALPAWVLLNGADDKLIPYDEMLSHYDSEAANWVVNDD